MKYDEINDLIMKNNRMLM